jgi:DNA-binding HxlR family transcriptional regulator
VRYAYSLTKKGMALGDVLLALVRWGKEYIPGTQALRQSAPKASQEAASSAPARAKVSRRRADP